MKRRYSWFFNGLLAFLTSLTGCSLSPKEPTKAFYPIGIYGVDSTNNFQMVKEAGFNLVTGPAQRAYLDAAQHAGLKVLASPHTSAGKNFDPTAAARAVKQFDQHPALWAWYLVDEPDLNEIPPDEVIQAHRCLKALKARKPTALVIYQGYEAWDYGNITDIMMVDRYPIPWLPLANFGQHVQMTRLGVGKDQPLIAVIQAFDWASYPEMLPGEKNFRAPTYEEMRCMTYEALARGANGLFYYAFDSGWKMREHPETWAALKAVIKEVNERLPLFEAKMQWWPKNHHFADSSLRFNAALESSVTSRLLRVSHGNGLVRKGDYILAVNNNTNRIEYSFALPRGAESEGLRSGNPSQRSVMVLGEEHSIQPESGRLKDTFEPYAVHVYGPMDGLMD